MNKLEGFYELKKSNLPTVPWEKYDRDTVLGNNILWTIRSAVAKGNDLNLPRKIGVSASEAHEFAQKLLKELTEDDMVIYYPYFIAIKSGVIDVSYNRTVIEAVDKDLWNLVTNNNKDVTIIFSEDDLEFFGDENFLSQEEMFELIRYCNNVKKMYRDFINNGKSVFLEWSYSQKADNEANPIGDKKLVFYEIRTV